MAKTFRILVVLLVAAIGIGGRGLQPRGPRAAGTSWWGMQATASSSTILPRS
jgi:hypothetical protein